jgi:predicted Rossmann fold nucleotide-binding protein DprA/Smf involved in DNA uptake
VSAAALSPELDRLSTRGIWIITRADEAYPPLFRSRRDTPAVHYQPTLEEA